MIKIDFYLDGLKVIGHANFANDGNDIICAGVSAIILGSLNWFEKKAKSIDVKDGYVVLIIEQDDNQAKEWLGLLKVQLYALNHGSYKNYLKFTEHNVNLAKKENE